MPLTIALLGCGLISRFHRDALLAAGARIAWCIDPVIDAAQAAAAACGAKAGADWQLALADPEVHAVVVCTPTPAHGPLVLAAIAAGKAVVCEKTLGVDADEALAMTRAARAAGIPLITNYMKRQLPAVVRLGELLPEIGTRISMQVRTWQCWGDLWTANPPAGSWAHQPADGVSHIRARNGGGVLHAAGSHLLDLLVCCAGRPQRVAATISRPAEQDYELRATALFDFADHSCATFEAVGHPYATLGYLGDGWDEAVEVSGTRGRLTVLLPQWDQGHIKAARLIHHDHRGTVHHLHFPAMDPFAAAVRAYVARITEWQRNGSLVEPMDGGYVVDELIQAMHGSEATGTWVTIPWRLDA